MAAIKSRDTKPEIKVRRMLHALGFRFRLHRKDLPGQPDIVLPRYRSVVFVHGCFWHQHDNCKQASKPKTRQEYWREKLAKNVARDEVNSAKLIKLGWAVIIVWECELRNPDLLIERLLHHLTPDVKQDGTMPQQVEEPAAHC